MVYTNMQFAGSLAQIEQKLGFTDRFVLVIGVYQ